MTVNEYRETACATAGPVEDMEIEENIVPVPPQPPQEGENENLLGRVLAGMFPLAAFSCIFLSL